MSDVTFLDDVSCYRLSLQPGLRPRPDCRLAFLTCPSARLSTEIAAGVLAVSLQ